VTEVSASIGRAPVSHRHRPGTQRRMEDNLLHTRATDESTDGSRTGASTEAAAPAVARLLANPRRTRRS
jgi:hypothetical protein